MNKSAKSLKLTNTLKWYPILSDDLTNKKFTFKTYMKANIQDNKKISQLVEHLQQIYPLNDCKFKRVKKLLNDGNKFEILLTVKELYKGIPEQFETTLSDISEIDLPIDKIVTKEQCDLVQQYWPISFHLNKYIESLLDGSFMSNDLTHKCDSYARLVLNLAKYYKCTSAAIIVDPIKGRF